VDEDGLLRITPRLAIPLDELEWRFSASGGPGGQHANTSNTRAEVRFDVRASAALTEHQRELLLERLGDVVRVAADDERSQARNRALALERLAERLASALHVPVRRRPTRPTRASEQRRLEAKRRQGERKRSRRPDPGDST
jgi:ribosome-associated protein